MVGQSENDIQDEQDKFTQLDVNKNQILDEEEMHMWASPNNVYVYKSYIFFIIIIGYLLSYHK